MRRFALLGVVALASFGAGCSKKGGKAPAEATPVTESVPEQGGKVIVSTGRLPVVDSDAGRIVLPSGDFIAIDTIRGEQYVTIQATLAEASFKSTLRAAKAKSLSDAELKARLELPLRRTVDALAAKIDGLENVRLYAEVGFFAAQMKLARFEQLGQITGLPADLVLSPVVVSPLDERYVRKMDTSLVESLLDARADTAAFSGLKRMGVPEFLELVKSDLGAAVPDGSRVKVGVTDTGITYNHPSLADAAGQPRIVYMKDFTGEGRIYFNPEAALVVEADPAQPDALKIKAQVLPVATGAMAKPVADNLKDVEATILVSPELRAALLTEGSGAKLGLFSESTFATATDAVDLNQNGKTDDELHAILVPAGEGAYQLFLDTTGDYDFRKATPVGDFNATKQTIKLVSERFGFDIRKTLLKDSDGIDVTVIGAGIVGFDPNNHGTHVAGIIGGRKTIANDSDATLARGAAPAAQLMMNRVCANNGGCVSTEAVIDLALSGAEIVNMSLGGLSPYNDGYGVGEIIIDRLTEMRNTLFVISAGNSGPGRNTVGSPSTARLALSVGATASRSLIERQYQWPGVGKPGPSGDFRSRDSRPEDDFMLFFSSRGPTAAGGFKPNISAPGTELSAIQLNAASGLRGGLDVYWGTSMAAPAASGALALLLDAAKLYNEKHPDSPLPLDALTLRKVVVASARPFDVTRFDTQTGALERGQYTWIDQGTGMIDLPRAWAALKAEKARVPSGVYAVDAAGKRTDIGVDYQVRVLRRNPNGLNYDGSIEISPDALALSGPLFGRGIWLDAAGSDTMIPVQIARRLPYSATLRDDAGDLLTRLKTSADKFVVRTVVYGSGTSWLKAGTLNALDCDGSVASRLDVVGEGAIDNFDAPTDRSIAARESTLYVCIDRAALSALPPGDHGALIYLTRASYEGDLVETNASVIVPVYVSVPHKTLAGGAGYKVTGKVQSFGVARHYVEVPAGTSLVSVKLEVPAATVRGNVVKGCQGVRLYVNEAGNTVSPAEIAGTKSIARNCNEDGTPDPANQVVTFARSNPRAGVWDLHVLGRYQFPESEYTLTVEFAKVETSVTKIEGTPAALDGAIDFKVLDASFAAAPSTEATSFALTGLAQTVADKMVTGEQKLQADKDGAVFRQFDEDVAAVAFATGGSTGNDIDLYALECGEARLATCKVIGQSATATDVELVRFTPAKDKFYAAIVDGYEMNTGDGSYVFTETRSLATAETGTVTVEALGDAQWHITHEFDQEASALLKREAFLSGKFDVVGALVIRTATGGTMTQVPVAIRAPEAQ